MGFPNAQLSDPFAILLSYFFQNPSPFTAPAGWGQRKLQKDNMSKLSCGTHMGCLMNAQVRFDLWPSKWIHSPSNIPKLGIRDYRWGPMFMVYFGWAITRCTTGYLDKRGTAEVFPIKILNDTTIQLGSTKTGGIFKHAYTDAPMLCLQIRREKKKKESLSNRAVGRRVGSFG